MNRPVLKYNGGKWMDGKWIVSHFPEHRVYGDLFGGGASVLMQKPRAKIEYYNDLDANVYDFFRVLRDRPKELIRAIRWTPYSRDAYNSIKDASVDSELQKALHFCIRCWMGRGNNLHSSFRTRGNVYGEGRYIPAKLWADLRPYYQAAYRLRGVAIENKDWYELAMQIDGPETLLYIDPPYPGIVRNGARLYAHDIRSVDQHRELLSNVLQLQSMIIISSYPNDLYSGLLTGWTMATKKSVDDQRRERMEALYISPTAANHAQPQLFGGAA